MKQAGYSADVELNMADIWRKRGKPERAIAGYRKVLEQQPENSEAHKQHINLMDETKSLEAAFEHYGLLRIGEAPVEIEDSDVLCCVVVRNESLRLPFFLRYHRELGIAKFLVVDNGSTDETLDYLLEQPDVYVWQSHFSFVGANYGSVWFELLLRKYGVGHWCLIADADELFYYPDCERIDIAKLCQTQEKQGYTAYPVVLLDMYSDKSISETIYRSGEDFRAVCGYFDRQFYHSVLEEATPYRNQTIYVGGLRERIFGKAGDYYVTKVPLIKYELDCVLAGGQHWTSYPAYEISASRGALLHFKYFSSFADYVHKTLERQENYLPQYIQYAHGLAKASDLMLHSPEHSLKLEGSAQLVKLGIMQETSETARVVEFPVISPVSDLGERPLWSVMITCHRATYLAQTLESVLMQAPGLASMQIEVVVDGVDAKVQAEIRAIAQDIGAKRVQVYTHDERIRQPYILNLAISRAKGHWVHILHDDDWLAPGFYQAMTAATDSKMKPGAAFCRHRYMRDGKQRWISREEKETAGVIENWMEKIVSFCHVQFSSMVVRRDVYEKLGGFCPQAKDAADWEMWKRIAAYYPVWYEPEPLMYYREHAASETSHLLRSGKQISEARETIFITRRYLPRSEAPVLSNIALENYAFHALDMAKQQLQRQDSEAAVINMREALRCSQSVSVQKALADLLLSTEVA
ncbi:MAG: glycosyltransferase family 2 protein [Cyanobacteria bacterium P01_D01_bin.105]